MEIYNKSPNTYVIEEEDRGEEWKSTEEIMTKNFSNMAGNIKNYSLKELTRHKWDKSMQRHKKLKFCQLNIKCYKAPERKETISTSKRKFK